MAAFLLGPRNPITGLRAPIPVVMQPNMRSKRLQSGQTSYYWRPPRRVEREGLPIHFEPRGTNFAEAVQRVIKLNAIYASFPKTRRKSKRGCAVLPFQMEIEAAA